MQVSAASGASSSRASAVAIIGAMCPVVPPPASTMAGAAGAVEGSVDRDMLLLSGTCVPASSGKG